MDEQKIEQIVQKILSSGQYRVSDVPYHLHNNVDAPFVPFHNLSNAPNFFCVAKTTSGTTAVNVFSSKGTSYPLTVTGIFLVSNDTTAGNITVKNNGNTVATIAKGTTAGVLVGATSLSNTSYNSGNSFTIVSDSAGNSTVFMAFTA